MELSARMEPGLPDDPLLLSVVMNAAPLSLILLLQMSKVNQGGA